MFVLVCNGYVLVVGSWWGVMKWCWRRRVILSLFQRRWCSACWHHSHTLDAVSFRLVHHYRAATWSLKSPKVSFLNTSVPVSQKVVPKVPISVSLAIFQLILTKFRVYILTKNVLGFLWSTYLLLIKSRRPIHILIFSMVWTMDTFENSVQCNCVDNMTLNSLELRTELLHAFD